jgi:hypothetical protein
MSQGTGLIGKLILNALIDSGKFTLTALIRDSSFSTFLSGIKTVKADSTLSFP